MTTPTQSILGVAKWLWDGTVHFRMCFRTSKHDIPKMWGWVIFLVKYVHIWNVFNTTPGFWTGRNSSTFGISKTFPRRSGVAVHKRNLWHQQIDGFFGVFLQDQTDSACSWVRKKRFSVLFRSTKTTHRCLSLLYKFFDVFFKEVKFSFFSFELLSVTRGI